MCAMVTLRAPNSAWPTLPLHMFSVVLLGRVFLSITRDFRRKYSTRTSRQPASLLLCHANRQVPKIPGFLVPSQVPKIPGIQSFGLVQQIHCNGNLFAKIEVT